MHSSTTAPPSISPAPAAGKRRLSRPAVALLVLVVLVLLAAVLGSAWQQTRLREAYLPDLEAQAQRSPTDGRLLALLGARLMEAGEQDAAAETLRRGVGIRR